MPEGLGHEEESLGRSGSTEESTQRLKVPISSDHAEDTYVGLIPRCRKFKMENFTGEAKKLWQHEGKVTLARMFMFE